ncbi:TPR end-of-group domain-containing protein [Kribbella orskensis]|uniref:TPR end-of-group domain-containing protein n=1 Tax=Kribbella orskensis TaxID=2512216 RepID=UPI003F6EA372
MLFFNLACCESRCGRTSDALDHLRHAMDMSAEFRASAKTDSDWIRSALNPRSSN